MRQLIDRTNLLGFSTSPDIMQQANRERSSPWNSWGFLGWLPLVKEHLSSFIFLILTLFFSTHYSSLSSIFHGKVFIHLPSSPSSSIDHSQIHIKHFLSGTYLQTYLVSLAVEIVRSRGARQYIPRLLKKLRLKALGSPLGLAHTNLGGSGRASSNWFHQSQLQARKQ